MPDNKDIGKALSNELGILNSLLYRSTTYRADFEEDTYLDLFIYQTGKKLGKKITGLENLETPMRLAEQAIKPINDIEKKKAQQETTKRNRHQITKVLNGKNFGEVMEDAYRNGNLTLLDSLSRLYSVSEVYHALFIIKRNEGMAKVMDSIMQKQSLFAGVGAAHLPNTYGVINLLRELGYVVTPVDKTKTEFNRNFKDQIEATFIKNEFTSKESFDGRYSVKMPGELYEFPESNNAMLAAYPDMANGAT